MRQGGPGGDAARSWVEGRLEACQRHDGVLARSVMVARLVKACGAEALPELIDAQLLTCGPDSMHFVGFERDPLTRRDTAQAWTYTGPGLDRFHCQAVRSQGAPRPRWIQAQASWHLGKLTMADELDPVLGRWVPVARFHGISQDSEIVQPLVAAKLTQFLLSGRVVLTGMNRHPETEVEQAQTWLLLPATEPPNGAGVLFGE
ncbi:hypothetical protein DBR42_00920 [Pelomonas sp. HMWF004]|nr:hypothetical protein DBR42_00920 [Pelomonas sp. HMWF004]